MNNPADIDYDPVNDRVCIPNAGNSTVTLFELGCIPTTVAEGADDRLVVFPNPAAADVRISGLAEGQHSYQVISPDGRVMLSGSGFRSGDLLNVDHLHKGQYVMLFTSTSGERLRANLQKD